MRENTNQKKHRIWAHFTQWFDRALNTLERSRGKNKKKKLTDVLQNKCIEQDRKIL